MEEIEEETTEGDSEIDESEDCSKIASMKAFDKTVVEVTLLRG